MTSGHAKLANNCQVFHNAFDSIWQVEIRHPNLAASLPPSPKSRKCHRTPAARTSSSRASARPAPSHPSPGWRARPLCRPAPASCPPWWRRETSTPSSWRSWWVWRVFRISPRVEFWIVLRIFPKMEFWSVEDFAAPPPQRKECGIVLRIFPNMEFWRTGRISPTWNFGIFYYFLAKQKFGECWGFIS